MGLPGRRHRLAALIALVRLGRPQFLIGGFLLYGLGAAVALLGSRAAGHVVVFDLSSYLLGQAAITAIQLMTHYANDYFDLAADVANTTPTRWSGGSRVLLSGSLPPRVALHAARLFATVGLALTALIAARGAGVAFDVAAAADINARGNELASAGVLALAAFLAWFYSAPPLALHSRGLGELTTAVVVTGLTPLAGYLLQAPGGAGALRALPVLGAALWPLMGLQFAMLLAIEFPDAAGDAAVGKRTLVVRLGGARAAALYRAVLVGVYGALPLFAVAGAPPLLLLAAALPAPVGAWQFWRLGRGAWSTRERWGSLAFVGVALLVTSAAAELLACLYIIRLNNL